MIAFARGRATKGLFTPGVFVLRPGTTIHDAIEAAAMIALLSDPSDWVGRVEWFPL